MERPEAAAARMRQLVDDAGIVPNEAGLALARVVIDTRPWADERRVSKALRSWAERFNGAGSLDRGVADGPGMVAEHMHMLGQLADPPSDRDMLGITFHMLRNVAARRGPTESDFLRDNIRGVPARTLRRYRQRVRAAGGDVGAAPLFDFMESLQYKLDLAALVHGGRTPAAARRWLERHPGLHARDAPPSRGHRS